MDELYNTVKISKSKVKTIDEYQYLQHDTIGFISKDSISIKCNKLFNNSAWNCGSFLFKIPPPPNLVKISEKCKKKRLAYKPETLIFYFISTVWQFGIEI